MIKWNFSENGDVGQGISQGGRSVRFPLRYKLLISIVVLILVVVGFLSVSSALLLKEDKRTYTYVTQETQAELAAKEMLNRGTRALDSARQALASLNAFSPGSGASATLQTILENQPSLAGLDLMVMDLQNARLEPGLGARNKDTLASAGYTQEAFQLDQESLYMLLSELKGKSFTWLNLSRVGQPPMTGIAFVDLKAATIQKRAPMAVAYIPLHNFSKALKGARVTVASEAGWILFDSDAEALFQKKRSESDPLFQFALDQKVGAGAKEFQMDGKLYLGSFVKSGMGLVTLARSDVRKAMGPFYSLLEKFVILGLMAIGIAILFAIFFAKTLTDPMKKLMSATQQISAGNFDLNLKTASRDEIGSLSESFNLMSQKINTLIKDQVEKTRIQGELAIASTVQKNLFPPPRFQNDYMVLRSFYQSASECGGDWWGLLTTKTKIGVFIADATGHGIPSALVTASARSCFSVIQKLAQDNPEFPLTPSHLLSYANRAIYEASSGSIMMTFFAAVFDTTTRELTYASAGHNPPWLFQKEEGGYTLKSLTSKGSRLGESRDLNRFEEKKIKVGPEDILFLYTDGITEGKNRAGTMYGKKQVRKIVEGALGSGPDGMLTALVKDFARHNENKPLDDDITLTAAKFI